LIVKLQNKALSNPKDENYLKAYLQSQGVKINCSIEKREGGAGPAEGITILHKGRAVNVPTSSNFVLRSPYSIRSASGAYYLFENDFLLSKIEIPYLPHFYSLKTQEGIPYKNIALLHGIDCLATTVFQNCIYWNSNKRCTFCGIELSLEKNKTIVKKSPQQLLEVIKAALKLDKIQHITLTTGTQADSSDELRYLATCCSYIKSETNLPIHVQFMPPTDLSLLDILRKSGADTVGIHIESFDFNVLEKVAPCKAELGLDTYLKTWEEAINIFGKNQVSSFLIVGLGEKKESVIEGATLLCELGVYPFIVPLRPIPGTPLANHNPPPPSEIILIYQQVAHLLKGYDLSWRYNKAGCVRCGACSALSDFENE